MSTPQIPLTDWPGPMTTGVPVGAVLGSTGSLELKTDGQVLTNLHISGRVNVYAKNVVIRKSRIVAPDASCPIRTFGQARGLLVEDVEIDGRGIAGPAVSPGDYTLRRVDIHDVVDGPRLGNRTSILDCWIHDLVRSGGGHNDLLQTAGGSGILVRHNRLDAYRASGDPMSACLTITSTGGRLVSDLLFEDNYCDGGDYTVSVRADAVGSNIVFRNNTFGRNHRYGVIARPRQLGLSWENTNLWHDSRRQVVI
ncbi:hypothetical protein I0C86_31550 [Plantactinospora sp. S1510]|uniref:Right handed beta helix domain-containing protein n=1 Tax=Plantactinospora alkalitolerans TaxID=2789879 RepID=A0ABS0H4S2_9ACTN|nr:hypothetical protein [Plantactinospora alkalitolerans]MBF9133461.1 hypothetical protein [Plantactinospora alkalitolerans]